MNSLRLVLGLEAAILSRPDVVLRAGRGCCTKALPRLLLHQPTRHSSYLQTEIPGSHYEARLSAETGGSDRQRECGKSSATEESAVAQGPASSIIQATVHSAMIMQYFNVSRTTAYRILDQDERLKNCDVYILARNMNILQENGFDPDDVRNFMMLLYRPSLTTEHRIAVMKEMGLINFTAFHFIQFIKLFNTRVSLVKTWGLLPQCYDPLEALASLGVPNDVLNKVKFSDTINNLTLAQLHQTLSSVYLSWRLNCTREEVSRLQETYILNKKSMRLQQKVLIQLEHDWDIHVSKVQMNGYLLTCSPVNMALINSKVKQIAGISTKEYALLTPRIFTIPYHQLLEVDHILSKLHIPPASFKALPRICTLHPNTLEERIRHLQQIPEFSALQSHPRMLHLLYSQSRISSRLNKLQEKSTTDAVPSLNILLGTKQTFSKYLTVGDLRQNKRDVITVLSEQLSVKPKVIRKCLRLQCWGSQVTVVNVQKNLSTLIDFGFTEEQLLAGLDVVLYPPDLLHDQLAQLPKRPQVQPFSEFKSSTNILQLLLYFMVKKTSLGSLT